MTDFHAAYKNCAWEKELFLDFFYIPEKWKKLHNTDGFVESYKKYFRTAWFRNQSAFWNNKKVVKFSKNFNLLLCFTFNMAKFDDVYRRGK
jgi:hypothetical protein